MTQVAMPSRTPAPEWPPCPPWCTYGPCTPADGWHVSDTYCVPVVVGVIGATLSLGEGKLEIVLGHGADELPSMTVDAAESLANGILELVRQARSSA